MKSSVKEIVSEFRKWLGSEQAIKYRESIANEKKDVKEMMEKLSMMDRNGEEFTDLVLYGLLPYYDRKIAKRTSTFPIFMNIKAFFKKYDYSDKDWNLIAIMIFSLAEKFRKEPEKLGQWILEFTSNAIYSRNLQNGSITPILFCINDTFPVINNKVIDTYEKFSNNLGWGDSLSQKLADYESNIPKCKKLMDFLVMEEMDWELFGLFCWWYDQDAIGKPGPSLVAKNGHGTKTSESETELVPVKSWGFIDGRIHKLPPPDMRSIDSIIGDIHQGRYAIPTFQREYAWTRKQVEELWESIFHGFFVGSILTWDYDNQVATEPAQGAPKLQAPTDIVLDGQQRITSLYHAVADPDMTSAGDKRILFFVNIKELLDPNADTADIVFSEDADKAKKCGYLDKKTQFAKKIFPLTQFDQRNYTLWLGEFKTYLKDVDKLPKADEYYTNILAILDHVWFKYMIPVVKLPRSLSLNSVAEIFEKINSKGTRLGVFDLLNARFTKYEINLRELWDKATSDSAEIQDMNKNFEDAAKFTLQGLCLFKKGYTRRKELLTLDDAYRKSDEFQKDVFLKEWDGICKYVSAAISKLKSYREDGFGAVALYMTPYTVIVPLLAALMYKIENRADMPNCMDKIQNWYWSAVTSDNYSGSTETKIEKDYRELLLWFKDDAAVPEIVRVQRKEVNSLALDTTKTNDSIYKAVICLVAKSGANDFAKNHPLVPSMLDDHHIFPKSLADKYYGEISINSILNRTVLDSDTKRKILKNKPPSKYIREIIDVQRIDESLMRKRLETHLISDDAFDCLLNDDFEKFVHERAKTIRATLRRLIVRHDESDDFVRPLLYTVESKHLEYKSSLRWDLKLKKTNPELEKTICKELCAFMNSEGGNLLIGVNDAGRPIGLEKDYATFKSKDHDGLVQHLTNLVNKYLGTINNAHVEFKHIQTSGVEICLCQIKPSQTPVFFNMGDEKTFFMRANNTCQPLNVEDASIYIKDHFWREDQ